MIASLPPRSARRSEDQVDLHPISIQKARNVRNLRRVARRARRRAARRARTRCCSDHCCEPTPNQHLDGHAKMPPPGAAVSDGTADGGLPLVVLDEVHAPNQALS